MAQAQAMAEVLVKSCQLPSPGRPPGVQGPQGYWIEIHRLENDGDRLYRDAVAALFANGPDPMMVIRWRTCSRFWNARLTRPRAPRTSSRAS